MLTEITDRIFDGIGSGYGPLPGCFQDWIDWREGLGGYLAIHSVSLRILMPRNGHPSS